MIAEKKVKPKAESILEAAGEIFAEQGFRKTTVRDICKRSGVNLAAINYYFGDKERLYLAVLKYYRGLAVQKYPITFGIHETDTPEEKLSNFVYTFICRFLEEGKTALFGKLLAREFTESTGALDVLVEDFIRPTFIKLSSIIREIVGNKPTDKKVELCAMSILGQCLYFRNARPIIFRLRHQEGYTSEDIEEIAEHIINFSLKGLIKR
jgi:TetR/AcrR family transcriptional regulator, regulator of cefoperazone and chloramphenicol sensitivity